MLIKNIKDSGKMINKMVQELIIGLMEKQNIKLLKTSIKGIGLMAKEMVSDVFIILMDVGLKEIFVKIRKTVWEQLWIKMVTVKQNNIKMTK